MMKSKKNLLEASRGAGARTCACKRNRSCVRFLLEEMKYLIISFLRTTKNSAENRKESVLTLVS